MKKSFFIFSIATAALALGSCGNMLDVNPTQTIETGSSLQTSRDIEAYLIGAYDGLQGTNTNGDTYSGGFQYTAELLGNDGVEFRFGGTFANLLELDTKTTTKINTTAEGQWVRAYNVINRCNTVLANLSKVDADKKDRFEGEAAFLRGALYFELVRLYGKQWGDGDNNTNPGVPLVLTPTSTITDASFVARASVAAVYAQAITDLTNAEAKLPSSNGVFANKWSAAALLARLYLQQGQNALARDAANRVIASGRFSLTATFDAAFNTKLNNGGANPVEYIFAVQTNDQDGNNGMNTFFGTTISSMPGTAGRGDMRILPAHIALYDTLDARGKYFIKPSNNTFTRKFLDSFGNVCVTRLAEMYLIRAECNQRLNTEVGAKPVEDINRLRNRAGLAAATSVTLNDILLQRRLELAFEGFRLHDIKRLRGTVGTLQWNDDKLVLPIPQREIDTNNKLVQNPGY